MLFAGVLQQVLGLVIACNARVLELSVAFGLEMLMWQMRPCFCDMLV